MWECLLLTWERSTSRKHHLLCQPASPFCPGAGEDAGSRADSTLQKDWGLAVRRRKRPDFELHSLFLNRVWPFFFFSPLAKLKLLLPVSTLGGDTMRAVETKRQLKKNRYKTSMKIFGLEIDGKLLVMRGWDPERVLGWKRGNKNLVSDVSRNKRYSCLQNLETRPEEFSHQYTLQEVESRGIAQTRLRRVVLALWLPEYNCSSESQTCDFSTMIWSLNWAFIHVLIVPVDSGNTGSYIGMIQLHVSSTARGGATKLSPSQSSSVFNPYPSACPLAQGHIMIIIP